MMRSIICLTSVILLNAGMGFADDAKAGRDLSDQDLTKFNYTKQKLEKANFERSILEFAMFIDCKMAGANLRNTHCTGATFRRLIMTGVDMTDADVHNAGFEDVDFTNAILDNVNFSGASIYNCKAIGASFRNAKGPSAVTKSDFTNADFRGADFSSSKDYGTNSAIYKGVKYDSHTKFPIGVDPEAVGAIFVKANAKDPDAGKSELGTPVRFYKSIIYVTANVPKSEAVRVGNFLKKEKKFLEGQQIQMSKEGKVFQIRLATTAGKEEDVTDELIEEYEKVCAKMATELYSPTTVEIHLCDGSFKKLKVLKATPAEPKPEEEPEAKPEPKRKADPKPDPAKEELPTVEPTRPTEPTKRVDPAKPSESKETEFGTELKYRKAQLYYTKKVSKTDAAKLGKFLVDELNFGRTPLKFQLNKSGSTIELRMAVKPGRENNAEFVSDCQALGKMVAKSVFPDDPVEVHLCDEELKTLKVVKPE